MKVGQWVRWNNKLLLIKETHNGWLYFDDEDIRAIGVKQYDNCKVANTPQELIEVGDLVIDINTAKFIVYDIVNGMLYDSRDDYYALRDITEIWTKTDNDTYKCQWRK